MKVSLGEILWKIWSKFFDGFLKLFLILFFITLFFIPLQAKPDFSEFTILFFPLYAVFQIANLIPFFPVWIQVIYLGIYFKFSRQLILYLLSSSGIIDYNFVWSLPKALNNLLGFPVSSEFVNLVFWSGFILNTLYFISSVENRFLIFMAKKGGVGWAKNELDKRLKEGLKAKGRFFKEDEIKDREIYSTSLPLEIKEKVVFIPKFFKDRLWYLLLMFLIMISPVLLILTSIDLSKINKGAEGLLIIFGGTALLIFLIFLPFFLWEITTRIILERDKITIKTFFFSKTVFFYQDIKSIGVGSGGAMMISYEKQLRGRVVLKEARFFPWPFTTEKVLQELKNRLKNINIDDNLIIKRTKEARGLTGIIVSVVTVGLLCGLVYYVIHREVNRSKYSDKDCANQLMFWISDKPKVGILETKDGFRPELNPKFPFYFWIKAKRKAPECKEKVIFTVFNKENRVVFQSYPLTPESLVKITPGGKIIYYLFENKNIFPDKGSYLLKVNYGDIPTKEINLSVK